MFNAEQKRNEMLDENGMEKWNDAILENLPWVGQKSRNEGDS